MRTESYIQLVVGQVEELQFGLREQFVSNGEGHTRVEFAGVQA
jgi:hypothetical protein